MSKEKLSKEESERIRAGEKLIKAAQRGDVAYVRKALDKGIDVNSPLILAFDDKIGEKVAHVRESVTLLHLAAMKGQTEVVELLVDHGADMSALTSSGETPLHYAANIETVALFLERGADVNTRGRSGNTPLHYAAIGGEIKTVALLLDRGADVNARNNIGWTPLHSATIGSHRGTEDFLKEHGGVE